MKWIITLMLTTGLAQAESVVITGQGAWSLADGVISGEGVVFDPYTGGAEYTVEWDGFEVNDLRQINGVVVWVSHGTTTIWRVNEGRTGFTLHSQYEGAMTGIMEQAGATDEYSYSNYSGLGSGLVASDAYTDVQMSVELSPVGGATNEGGYSRIKANKESAYDNLPVYGEFSLTIELPEGGFSPISQYDIFTPESRQCN